MAAEPEDIALKPPRMLFAKNIIRKFFFDDWVIKLVALVITFSLWLGVTGLSTPTTTRFSGVPLSVRVSNDTEIVNSPIQEVDIVVSGDKRRVGEIVKGDLVVSLDLTDVQPGDRVVQLTPENVAISLPTGIKLDEIQPNKIAITLEPVEEKDVDVRVETESEVADGFEVYSETVLPPKVRVRGPASFIRSLTFVTTDKVALANRQSDFTAKQVPVSISNPNATVLESVVDVVFRIGEKRIERLYLVPVSGDPRRATVILFGPRSIFENVRPDDMSVEADGAEPRLVLPPELEGKVVVRKLTVPPRG